MNDEPGRLTWAKIETDLEGTQKSRDGLESFFASEPDAVRDWKARHATKRPTRGSYLPANGYRLIRRCPEPTLKRYATLLHQERSFEFALDHSMLIAAACQILESELDRLLAAPALPIVEALITTLRLNKKDRDQAEILEKWARKEVWTTIGIESIVLMALRRGLEHEEASAREFLDSRFAPAFRDLVTNKQLGQCLDAIRTVYRNPACHGTALFDADGYSTFARLVVANTGFTHWDIHGPDPSQPDAAIGILHHHLSHVRPTGPGFPAEDEDNPLARLLALRTPPSSPLVVNLLPHRAGESRGLRDVTVTPPKLERPFRLNDAIRFALQTNRSCHVVLIDVGTTGKVSVILPNSWRRETWTGGSGLRFFPDVDRPEFGYILSGQTGQERVFAIATIKPLQLPLVPDSGEGLRVLTLGELGTIVDAFGRLSPGWAIATCSFEIEP